VETSGFAKVEWAGDRLGASFARITRQAQPEEIGELVAFLGSDAATNVNGAVVTSDGGWMAA
jgi:NAD(P)-dependent dehydrogenase (short-subunit alcohol dehydrogenase family)